MHLQNCLKIGQTSKQPLNPEENPAAGKFPTEFSTDSVDTFFLALHNESGQRESRINQK
jgi:hypothetical protein